MGYAEWIISSAERILVDTSTLMTDEFARFIKNNKEMLSDNKKKIIVPKSVYTELTRNMTDETKPEKSELADRAMRLLARNEDIFQIDSIKLSDEELRRAFADKELIMDLIAHKGDCAQLLITNDRGLSVDAFNLNLQQSYKGRKVLVCFINRYGELCRCECAKPAIEMLSEKIDLSEQKPKHIDHNTEETMFKTQKETWGFDWKSGTIGFLGTGFLYALYVGLKALLRGVIHKSEKCYR